MEIFKPFVEKSKISEALWLCFRTFIDFIEFELSLSVRIEKIAEVDTCVEVPHVSDGELDMTVSTLVVSRIHWMRAALGR